MAFSFTGFLKGILLQNEVDRSKQLAIQASSAATTNTTMTVTSAQTTNQTLTLPDATDTLTANAATQTLTNKTLGSTNTATGINMASFTPDNGAHTLTAPAVTDTLTANAATQTLTNKTLSGNTATNLVNGAGTFNLNSSGSLTAPNATDTLVAKNTTDTLTNKTLGSTNTATGINMASFTPDGGTHTLTAPAVTDTLTANAATQTLTNKTLSGNTATNLVNSAGTFNFNSSGTLTAPNATDTLVGKSTTDTLANKTLNNTTVETIKDSNLTIQNAADTTKQAQFSNATIATGTTRTFTFPDITDTLVTNNSTANLQNKYVSFTSTTDATATGSSATSTANNVGIIRLTNASLVSLGGITAGNSGQMIVVENKTGNSITVNNEDTGATAANRIQAGGANVLMASNATFTFVYDSTSSRWQLASGSNSAASGGKNYLSVYTASTASGAANAGNGNFEQGSTAGWSLAKTALTSLVPSSVGTGGNPFSSANGGTAVHGTFTLSTVTAGNQLSGTYSGSLVDSAAGEAGDMLISSAFFIDASDQGKVLPFSFSYKNVTGTQSFTGSSTNTWAVYFYDVTNNAWLQPVGVYNMFQSSGVGICAGSFQTNTTSTRYQIAVVEINAPAATFSLYVDDFVVGSLTGANSNASNQYSPTVQKFTATGSGTYNTPSGVQYIKVRMAGGGGGGAGSGNAGTAGSGNVATASSASSFGTSLLTANAGAPGVNNSTANTTGGTVTINSPAISLVSLQGGSGGGQQGQVGGVNAGFAGGIGGSNSFGGQGVGGSAASGSQNSGQAAIANTGGGGGGGASSSNAGATIYGGNGGAAGGYIEALILNPSSSYSYTVGTGGSGGTAGTNGVTGGAGGSGVIIVEEFYTPLGVVGQSIGPTGTVSFVTQGTATSITTTSSVLTWSAATTDTNGGFNGTTTYTVPMSGLYDIRAYGEFVIPAAAVGAATSSLQIKKNGTLVSGASASMNSAQGIGNVSPTAAALEGYRLNAGDTLQVFGSTNNAEPNTTMSNGVFSVVMCGAGPIATQNRVFAGPSVTSIGSSGSYNFPIGTLYAKIIVSGAGGGGGGSNGGGAGGSGGSTTVTGTGVSLTCTGGGGGGAGNSASASPAAGTVTSTTGINSIAYSVAGGRGGGGGNAAQTTGPCGGVNKLGGCGGGGGNANGGTAAVVNSGAGGGGSGASNAVQGNGGSGSAGGYLEGIITTAATLSSTNTLTITLGAGGSAGAGAQTGGLGGSGYVEIWAYFQ